MEKVRYSIAHLGAVAYVYEEKSHRLLASLYHKKKLRREVKVYVVTTNKIVSVFINKNEHFWLKPLYTPLISSKVHHC